MAFDTLPDDVLFHIFDFYRMGSTFYPWTWITLAHVCSRWRQIIFASPRRLDLQFLCTPRTRRVRELLDSLPPAMPIMISNSFDSPTRTLPPPMTTPGRSRSTLSLEDGRQAIFAAIEQRERVWWIHLHGLSSALVDKLATMMQETFPKLRYLRLWAADDDDGGERVDAREFLQAAVTEGLGFGFGEGFLGGSAPDLESFMLRGIPFSSLGLSKFLLSTNELVHFVLERIPDSGYISPEAMIAALSTCTKLEMLVIDFLSEDAAGPSESGTESLADPTSSQEIISTTTTAAATATTATATARIRLPALTYFNFDGNGSYFDNFVPRIESPLLARDSNPFWQHDTSVIRHVHYEASFTQTTSMFSSRYISRPLVIPFLEDE